MVPVRGALALSGWCPSVGLWGRAGPVWVCRSGGLDETARLRGHTPASAVIAWDGREVSGNCRLVWVGEGETQARASSDGRVTPALRAGLSSLPARQMLAAARTKRVWTLFGGSALQVVPASLWLTCKARRTMRRILLSLEQRLWISFWRGKFKVFFLSSLRTAFLSYLF